MPNKTRIQTPGLVRHVVARGNGRMPIFLDAVDFRQFEFLLELVVEEYAIDCWGFVGMTNHYHAILRPTRPNISSAMQRLNGEYGKWWNRRHTRVGHTFQGRFKDQIVSNGEYMMTLIRYVARNPLRANMVRDLADWRCGSFRALAGLDVAPAFLSVATVLRLFGDGDVPDLQERFKRWVLDERDEGAIEDRIRSNDRILGDKAFKRAVRLQWERDMKARLIAGQAPVDDRPIQTLASASIG